MRSALTFVFGPAASLLLAACGGGGGSPPSDPGPQTAFHVNAATGSDVNPGTLGSPLRTITAALALADAGHTVFVAPGTYDAALGEAFPLLVPAGVTVQGDVLNRGDGAVPTLVSGHAPIAPGDFHHAAFIPAAGCVLRGLKIQAGSGSSDHNGIWIQDATVEVHDCTFALQTFSGVWVTGSGPSNVHDNTFGCNNFGASIVNATDAVLIHDNQFATSSIQVQVYASNLCVVSGNSFVGGTAAGVYLEGSAAHVTGNTFPATGWNWGGITVQGGSPVLRANTFACLVGIDVFGGTPDVGTAADAGGNNFVACTAYGLMHEGAAALQAQGNVWKQDPPTSGAVLGVDITVPGTGSVMYGPGAGDHVP